MKWSFSENLAFRACPRKWYFAYKMANALARTPIRKEAFHLSKLQSIEAWRGKLVDQIISDEIIPHIKRAQPTSLDEALAAAKNLFDTQLKFAENRSWRNPTARTGDADYTALFEIEFGEEIAEKLLQAWNDIEFALANFFQIDEIWDVLRSAKYLRPQERLGFRYQDAWLTCVPDLIVLTENKDPIVIDWKVHKFGVKDYRQQLGLYALALEKSAFRKKYPIEFAGVRAIDVELYEVQLLTKKVFKYDFLEFEVDDIKSVIGSSARQMQLMLGNQNEVQSYLDIPTTKYPETCHKCPFQSICWEGSKWEQETQWQESRQTSFLF
jgi:hypothetical protein